MWRGLYTAAAGMIQETIRTDTIANNLANVDTTGYKRDRALSEEFNRMLMRRVNDFAVNDDVTTFKQFSLGGRPPVVGELGLGAAIREIATDHAQGVFETTGNPYDVAISGPGYFEIQTDQGVRYTRDGAFFRSATGELENVRGQAVLGANGQPINIPANATNISIGAQGQIQGEVDGEWQDIGQLAFVQFDDRRAVIKQGDNLYFPQAGAAPAPATGTIEQGMLERSNANVVNEMVDLINNYRIYEAGSKALMSQDTLLESAVTEVGRLS